MAARYLRSSGHSSSSPSTSVHPPPYSSIELPSELPCFSSAPLSRSHPSFRSQRQQSPSPESGGDVDGDGLVSLELVGSGADVDDESKAHTDPRKRSRH